MLFNELTVTYLFLGGTGAGMCVVLSLLECFTARESMSVRLMSAAPYESPISRISSALALPSEFFTRAWPACFVLLALGVLCLLVDVGRPERLFNLLFSPQPTAMSVGSYAIAVTLLCSGAFSAMSLLDNVEPSRTLSLAIAIVGVASGLVTAVYTGVLLSSLASVLAYRTPLLPALFCVSSLSCGLAGCADAGRRGACSDRGGAPRGLRCLDARLRRYGGGCLGAHRRGYEMAFLGRPADLRPYRPICA